MGQRGVHSGSGGVGLDPTATLTQRGRARKTRRPRRVDLQPLSDVL